MIRLLIQNRTTKALQEKVHGIYLYSLIVLATILISNLFIMDIFTIKFVIKSSIKAILGCIFLSILFYYIQIKIPESIDKTKERIDIIMSICFFILSLSLSLTLFRLYLSITFL